MYCSKCGVQNPDEAKFCFTELLLSAKRYLKLTKMRYDKNEDFIIRGLICLKCF